VSLNTYNVNQSNQPVDLLLII